MQPRLSATASHVRSLRDRQNPGGRALEEADRIPDPCTRAKAERCPPRPEKSRCSNAGSRHAWSARMPAPPAPTRASGRTVWRAPPLRHAQPLVRERLRAHRTRADWADLCGARPRERGPDRVRERVPPLRRGVRAARAPARALSLLCGELPALVASVRGRRGVPGRVASKRRTGQRADHPQARARLNVQANRPRKVDRGRASPGASGTAELGPARVRGGRERSRRPAEVCAAPRSGKVTSTRFSRERTSGEP